MRNFFVFIIYHNDIIMSNEKIQSNEIFNVYYISLIILKFSTVSLNYYTKLGILYIYVVFYTRSITKQEYSDHNLTKN